VPKCSIFLCDYIIDEIFSSLLILFPLRPIIGKGNAALVSILMGKGEIPLGGRDPVAGRCFGLPCCGVKARGMQRRIGSRSSGRERTLATAVGEEEEDGKLVVGVDGLCGRGPRRVRGWGLSLRL